MFFKLIALIIVAAVLIVQAQTASTRKQDAKVAAIYIKDANSGQLRFLGNGFMNNQINQLITNKQNFLEQFRPAGNWGGNGVGNVIPPTATSSTITNTPTNTNIDTITNTATNIDTDTDTGAGIDTSSPVTNTLGTRLQPLVINRKGVNAVNANRRRKPNRRRTNRRHGNKRRRSNKKPQIIIVRPRS